MTTGATGPELHERAVGRSITGVEIKAVACWQRQSRSRTARCVVALLNWLVEISRSGRHARLQITRGNSLRRVIGPNAR